MSEQATNEYDYSSAPNPDSDSQRFVELRQLVKEQYQAEAAMREAATVSEQAAKAFAEYRDVKVPKAAKALGLTDTTVDGLRLIVNDDVFGSLPSDPVERAAAVKWLDDNGHGAVVSRVLTVTLPRGAADIAQRIITGIRKAFTNLDLLIEEKVDVHHSTLKKLARELLEGGEQSDLTFLKTLGLVQVTRSKVTASKK